MQDPYTVELAYRWFMATFSDLLENRDHLLEKIELDDGCTFMYEKRLNDEIRASYHLCLNDDDGSDSDDDNDGGEIRIEYIIELFDKPRVCHKIPVLNESIEFIQHPNVVRTRIQQFCKQVHYICKCGSLAKPRLAIVHLDNNLEKQPEKQPEKTQLEHRCESCFVYWYKRTDDRCSVCLEDEGVWVKLSCGHILHQHCWTRIKGFQCPVCRTVTDNKENIYKYPYFKK